MKYIMRSIVFFLGFIAGIVLMVSAAISQNPMALIFVMPGLAIAMICFVCFLDAAHAASQHA